MTVAASPSLPGRGLDATEGPVERFHFHHGRVELDCRLELFEAGLRLQIAATGGLQFAGTLLVGDPASVSISEGATPPASGLVAPAGGPLHVSFVGPSFVGPGSRRLDYAGSDEEFFERALAFACHAAGIDPGDPRAPGAIQGLRRFLARAARATVARCDPGALAVARRFHPLARFHVYRHALGDRSSRVRQVAVTCPGALILTSWLEERGDAAAEILRAVANGKPLSQVLMLGTLELLDLQITTAKQAAANAGLEPHLALEGSRDAQSVERWSQRMRLLLRRAGPQVSPLDLCGLPPPVIVPEDIPAASRANAHWYAAMRVASEHWLIGGVPPGAWSFLSKNAVQLAERVDSSSAQARGAQQRRATGSDLARKAVEHGLQTGRWPARESEPGAWLETVQGWKHVEGRAPARRLGTLLEKVRTLELGQVVAITALDPDLGWPGEDGFTFPRFDGPEVSVAGVELHPVSTAVALSAEGRRMGNCVATWCEKLVGGARWIFSGSILGAPATVDVRRLTNRYVIEQAQGVGNQALTDAQRRRLGTWLKAINGFLSPRARRVTKGEGPGGSLTQLAFDGLSAQPNTGISAESDRRHA